MGIYIGQQRLAYLWGKIKSIIPTKVSDLTNDSGFTSNVGTITGITMNGTSKGTSGVVNLGTVITEHQDISGKQDALVSGTNIKTINNESILGSGNITISGGSGDTNVIETVKVNGTALTPDANKAVDVTVPTESTVTGWGFTKNGGTVTSTGGTAAVNNIQVVSALPASPDANTLYLIPES